MDRDFIEVYDYLEKNYPQVAEDLYYSLELFVNSLNSGIDAISMTVSSNSKEFSLLTKLAKYGNLIKDLNTELNKYLDSMIKNESIENKIVNKKILPDYSKYQVDCGEQHLLTEDFTNKKVCGFMLKGVRYDVSTWRDVLITLCEVLAEQDTNIIQSFPALPEFRGRKNIYFSKNGKGKYYRKLKSVDIYVWVNLNVITICEIIRNVLKSYSISINDFYVYLRADYTSLHNKDNN